MTKTLITFQMEVPLSIADIRLLVHLIDEENSGPGDGIDPDKVKASDYLAAYFMGEVQDVTSSILQLPDGTLTETNVVTDFMQEVEE